MIKTAYRNFYKDLTKEEAEQLIDLWAELFESDPVNQVTEAVKSLIYSLQFPPTIADVKGKLSLINTKPSMSAVEAWGLIAEATQDSLYNSVEQFNKLPALVQRLVGSPTQLKEWATMDSDIVNSVVASNFQKSYREVAIVEKEYQALPESAKRLKEMLGNTVKALSEFNPDGEV
jgi:hypothetical protein